MMDSVTVIFTCYNRKDKTQKCLESINERDLKVEYIITDDGSTDGTSEMLKEKADAAEGKMTILSGNGQLFWAGGMRKGMGYYLEGEDDTDYVALVNDDVTFDKDAFRYMIQRSRSRKGAVVVGAVRDGHGDLSYSGIIVKDKKVKYHHISPEEADDVKCDTFNCNCVLIPNEVFRKAGNFDDHYTHSFADYDYGFHLNRLGYTINCTDRYIGTCEDNDVSGTWKDTSLKRIDRIRKKESPKGLPYREWFYYLKKNFGLGKAIWHSLTPYLRIMLNI